ncbi:MAG: hypothetical protein WBP59_12515, partial [Ilumatobacteraceae bacterium]
MSLIASTLTFAGLIQADGHDIPFDDKGYTTIDPILPPKWEMIIGSAASIIVFVALYKYAGPIIKKSFADRTAGIQQK